MGTASDYGIPSGTWQDAVRDTTGARWGAWVALVLVIAAGFVL